MKGRFCECDNTNCPLNTDGKMCSGRGACECGRCLCELGWSGDDCGCSDDQSPCTVNGVGRFYQASLWWIEFLINFKFK